MVALVIIKLVGMVLVAVVGTIFWAAMAGVLLAWAAVSFTFCFLAHLLKPERQP